ncbi:MAG TPA: ATP-binding protein [Bryobacteraceae bacterium]
MAREAAGHFEILMEEKSLSLNLRGDESLQVEGDPIFLRQALVNIIHNAVKYSAAGDVVSIFVHNGNASHVTIEVKDNGPGIRVEDQSKVFDRFYRVDRARWRESAGAGLGLSIAKWAVEAHGGAIAIESELNRGSTFRVTLPSTNIVPPEELQRSIASANIRL